MSFVKDGGTGGSFKTVSTPAGSSPIAVGQDTLVLTSTDGSVTITGTVATDTIDFSVAGGSIGGFTQGSVIFSGATNLDQDNANFFWDDTSNFLGIGMTNPQNPLGIAALGVTAGTNEQIELRSQRAAIVSANLIGGLSFRSNDTTLTAPGTISALFQAVANETHTATALGTDFVWQTTAATTTTLSEKMRLNGTGRLGIGTTTLNETLVVNGTTLIGGRTAAIPLLSGASLDPELVIDSSGATQGLALLRSDATATGSTLFFAKARAANTVVVDGDTVGTILFVAHDGTDYLNNVAAIIANIDGTPGANDTPGRLMIYTTADGSNSVSERMRFQSNGFIGIGRTDPSTTLDIRGADNAVTQIINIPVTQANVTAADIFISFRSGAAGFGSEEGNVAGTAVAGVLAFNTFTGSHWSQADIIQKIPVKRQSKRHSTDIKGVTTIEELGEVTCYEDSLIPGTILCSTDELCEWPGEINITLPKCRVSDKAEDPTCYGIYGGHDRDSDILCLAIGSGVIRVIGPISIGDFICTSDVPGVGRKYDGLDMRVVVAKCRESWKNATEKIVACTIMAG